jgi:hypothetical protein
MSAGPRSGAGQYHLARLLLSVGRRRICSAQAQDGGARPGIPCRKAISREKLSRLLLRISDRLRRWYGAGDRDRKQGES